MPDYDILVIGAGLGGLSAGALLAAQGRRVLVLEQSKSIGGCCSTFEREGSASTSERRSSRSSSPSSVCSSSWAPHCRRRWT